MALFDFQLKAIDDIVPWGEAGNYQLHWFGLTDGYYSLKANGHDLFRYTSDILHHWNLNTSPPYPDYQIARLYEDVLDIVPNVMQSIPEDIFNRIHPIDCHQSTISRLNQYFASNDERAIGRFNEIAAFLGTRYLDSMHLTQGPDIWLLRQCDDLYIRWFNEDKMVDELFVWEDKKGELRITPEDFMSEVKAFHENLMDQMHNRIHDIKSRGGLPNIKIDIEMLEKEQVTRMNSLSNAMKQEPEIKNWDNIDLLFNEFDQYQREKG